MLCQPNRFFDAVGLRQHVLVIISAVSPRRNKKDTKECEKTAAHEFGGLFLGRLFEIAIQHCTADDDTQCEHDELDGDDLSRVKAGEGLVDISNLHNGS